MAAPIYFFPRVSLAQLVLGNKLNPAVLAPRNLLDTLGDVRDVADETSKWELTVAGPGGESGTMLTVLGIDEHTHQPLDTIRLKYAAEWQTWTKVVDDGKETRLWIGLDNEHPVTPGDLRRRHRNISVRGYSPELADGNKWLCPVVRRLDDTSNLPSDLTWDAAGNFCERIKEQYRQLWEDSAQMLEWWLSRFQGVKSTDIPRAVLYCIRVLGLAYRYDPALHNLLRIVDSETWASVLACAIDVPRIEEMTEAAKKKNPSPVPPEASSLLGQEEGSLDTAPVAAS